MDIFKMLGIDKKQVENLANEALDRFERMEAQLNRIEYMLENNVLMGSVRQGQVFHERNLPEGHENGNE